MEEEVKKGIQKFESKLKASFPDLQMVVPTRPTGGAYLVSFTVKGIRVYETLPEDALADWGEEIPESQSEFDRMIQKVHKKIEA